MRGEFLNKANVIENQPNLIGLGDHKFGIQFWLGGREGVIYKYLKFNDLTLIFTSKNNANVIRRTLTSLLKKKAVALYFLEFGLSF